MAKDSIVSSSIRHNAAVLFILGLVISGLLGWMTYENNINKYLDNIIQEQQRDITQSLVIFSHEIADMQQTIKLLHDAPSINSALSEESKLNRPLAEKPLVAFIHTFESLMQARWLDSQGKEQVRVDGKNGQPFIIPEVALQDKKDRYYFTEGIQAPAGQPYLSPLDLNIENGKIEIPYRPTIRVTLRTDPIDNLKPGLLVLNYDVGALLNSLREFNNEKIQLQIVDQKGFWIMHPNKAFEWGHDLQKRQNNMQVMDPNFWHRIQHKNSIDTIESQTGLSSYQCTDLTQGYVHNDVAQNTILCFIAETPNSIIIKQKWMAAIPAILMSSIIFLSGCWILVREQKASMKLIEVNKQLAEEKTLLEHSTKQTQTLLKQQQILQDDLVESGKLSALGMMVAGVAHELNTPLGAAMMASSTIRKEHDLLTESVQSGLTKNALHRYIESTQLGLELVEDNQKRAAELVRSFKRLAIDRAREEIVAFNLQQVISDLIQTLHHRLKIAHIETELNIRDIEMLGTPGIISQILQNLVMNAITHAFEPELGGKLTISATLNQDIVELKISDNGKGIDPELTGKIFDPFITSKRSQGSTGLGMHFVHQWVTRSLNGTISVETEVNKGTTFVVRIPKELTIALPDD